MQVMNEAPVLPPYLIPVKAVPELRRELRRVSNLNQSINRHHHIKENVEISHLSEFDGFRSNRDQV